jgi:hypothetical protein
MSAVSHLALGARWSIALALLSAATLGCSPSLRDDVYACVDTAACPAGFTCVSGRCRRGSGDECVQDFECRQDECNTVVCEAGFCSRTPTNEGIDCYDGTFCNGRDICQAGACANVGPPPCASCREDTACSDCGLPTQPCCGGVDCFESLCVAGTCRACGLEGDRCCLGEQCGDGLTCVGETGPGVGRCTPCGGTTEPCCIGSTSTGLCTEEDQGCDIAAVPPSCTQCGSAGQPCCATGCLEGYCNPDTFRCEVAVCDRPCGPDEVCFETLGLRVQCVPCGIPDFPCCPGVATCSDGTECVYGGCQGSVEPL